MMEQIADLSAGIGGFRACGQLDEASTWYSG